MPGSNGPSKLNWVDVVRFGTVIAVLVFGLSFLGPTDLDRLTNVLTILAIVVPVWALFDRALLRWVLRRVHIAWTAIKKLGEEKQPAEATATPAAASAPASAAASASAAAAIATSSAAADQTTDDEIDDPPVPWRSAIVVGLLVVGAFAWLLWAQPKPPDPPPAPPVARDPPVPAGPQAPPQPPTPTPGRTFTVPAGGSCWATARALACDGERYRELGPPLNEIEVSGECPLRAGRVLKIPPEWPESCPAKP